MLGVQWHPEQGSDPRLFTALVSAAHNRTAAGRAADNRAAAGRAADKTAGAEGPPRTAAGKATAGQAVARSTVLAPMV